MIFAIIARSIISVYNKKKNKNMIKSTIMNIFDVNFDKMLKHYDWHSLCEISHNEFVQLCEEYLETPKVVLPSLKVSSKNTMKKTSKGFKTVITIKKKSNINKKIPQNVPDLPKLVILNKKDCHFFNDCKKFHCEFHHSNTWKRVSFCTQENCTNVGCKKKNISDCFHYNNCNNKHCEKNHSEKWERPSICIFKYCRYGC